MLCFICNQKLTVGKFMHKGEYGLTEVDIKIHCPPCNALFRKKLELNQKIESHTIEMKGFLREYRQLKKNKDSLIQELLDLEYKIFHKSHPQNQLYYLS